MPWAIFLELNPTSKKTANSRGNDIDICLEEIENPEILNFRIDGMVCPACAWLIHNRLSKTLDEERGAAREKRYEKGYRTARENLDDLVDKDSFVEYGQLAIAAQKSRRELEELRTETAADGIITGFGKINSEILDDKKALSAIIINDYSVLAGTQGYYHHKKLDRICETAEKQNLPVVMYTEGGGGRPGDTDVHVQFAGLQIPSFSNWAKLKGKSLRVAVNNGYCFAGNAALFGTADFCISTKNSWLGMAGPAMIEGGGLGKVNPKDIGPAEELSLIHI